MIKVGIIGSGFGLYGQLPAFNSVKGCRVVCICGKKTERLVNYCQSIGLKNIYTDWREMLKRENLDAVAIAVPPTAQYKIAKAALKKGLHIFAEKPLATNLKQAGELQALAQKHKVTTAVDFIFPEIEEFEKTKLLLEKKTYGNLREILANWDFLSYDIKNGMASWKTDVKLGGGALSFYFSHVLYNLEYFGGKIKNIKAVLSHSEDSLNGGEVGVDCVMKFAGGASGQAHVSCNNKGLYRHQLTFICDRATLVLENIKDVSDGFTLTVHTANGHKRVPVGRKTFNNHNQDQRVRLVKKIAARFVLACSRGAPVTPSFKDGLHVQELISKIRSQQI